MFTDLSAEYSEKRLWCALFLCVAVATSFWSLSRYPDLVDEWQRSRTEMLLDRNVGAISKTEMMSTSAQQPAYERVFKTGVNWMETNLEGMAFGILFGSCLLVLLGQTSWIRKKGQQSTMGSLFSGLALGAPLGVCANCATPIGLSMYRSGIRLETVLATMVASPSLNPVGLLIVFSVFPLSMALLKLGFALLLVLVAIPLMLRLIHHEPAAEPVACLGPPGPGVRPAQESWGDAAVETVRLLLSHLWFVVKWTVPFMVVIAVLAALVLTYYPLEQLLFFDGAGGAAIVAAALIGALLPTPMFVDIIIVLSLLSFGMARGPATALLVSLGPVSLYASIIIWRHVSRRVATTMLLVGAVFGMLAGFAQVYLDKHPGTGAGAASQPTFVIAAVHDHSETPQIDVLSSIQNFVHSGASWGDYDGDGDDDLWVSATGGGRLYCNEGEAGFVDVTEASGIIPRPQSPGGLWADYDADGDQDLLILYYGFIRGFDWHAHANMLWRNDGDGTFTDVTLSSGMALPNHTTAAAWGDYDQDGDLDVYISNYGTMKAEKVSSNYLDVRLVESQVNQLFRNNGDGTFTDVAEAAGVAGRKVISRSNYEARAEDSEAEFAESCYCSFQPLWFDYDNDGHLDLFVANDFGTSQLYHNDGSGGFEDVTVKAGVSKYSTGMGVAVTDINRDGYLDFYETTIEDNPFWINNRDGTFKRTRVSYLLDDRERYGWGVAFLDYDNDGHEDLMIANGLTVTGDIKRVEEFSFSTHNINSFYRNLGNGNFVNILQEVGLVNSLVSRGLAVSDYDRDGYPDVYVNNKVGENVLYRNTGGNHNWLAVRLRGTSSNRDGIGATITVVAIGVSQTQLVTAGSSYSSQHSLWRNFGLGEAARAEKVIVRWPAGVEQTLTGVAGRQHLLIKEPLN